MLPIFEELRSVIHGEITDDEVVLQKVSTDNSIFSLLPQAVVYPKTTSDLKTVILFAKKYHIPVTVRGRGGGSSGGSLGEGIILDMSRYFDAVHRLEIETSTITVSSGVSVRELLRKIEPWGYTLPYSNKGLEERTFGGLLGDGYRNPDGEGYTGIASLVEKIKVVLDDGNEYSIETNINPEGRLLSIYTESLRFLTKNVRVIQAHEPTVLEHSMGYNVYSSHISPTMLISMTAGSQGTFGIITEITLRLSKIKESSTEIKTVPRKPSALTLDLVFDTNTFESAVKEIAPLSNDLGIHLLLTQYKKTGVVVIDIQELPSYEKLVELLNRIAYIIKLYKGASTYGNGDGMLWTPFLPSIFGTELMKAMKELKTIWDPQNIFNPGKKTTMDIGFTKKHYNP